ncbi:MAG: PsbP-related protein [Candidatus Methanoperedens sp.]|nr:PsbP-related protein [Candidatus Methanoperedens sp.]
MIKRADLVTGVLIVLFLIALQSGCIGFQRTNLTFYYPSNMETLIGKQETLQIEVLPLEADARDIAFSLYAPSEISLIDPQSKEFKKLAKDQKVIIPFNYSATTDGTFNLTLEVKMPENSTKYNVTVNASVPAPELEVGEFWVYNQTKGVAKGLVVEEVVRKDIIEGKEYYVLKETWDGEPNGTYALSYYSTDDFSQKMTEYYEDDLLLKEKTVEVDPPSSDFPFKVGTKGSWSGSVTGIGKSEVNGEVVKKEKITVPLGTYTGYYLRKKTSYSMATGIGEQWYVPELNGFAKARTSTNALGVTSESEMELLEHSKSPVKPRQVQHDIKIPDGYKLYKNDDLNFRMAYPKNWKFSSTEDSYGSYFNLEDSTIYKAYVTVEPIGSLNLTEYRGVRLDMLKKLLPGVKISEEKNIIINGREGIQWVYEYAPIGAKGNMVVFVEGNKGYIISGLSLETVYNSYKPVFDNIVNSFFIKGSQNKYILS